MLLSTYLLSLFYSQLFLNPLAAKFLEALKKDYVIDCLGTRGWVEAVRQVGSHSADACQVRNAGEKQCRKGGGQAGPTGCLGIKEHPHEFEPEPAPWPDLISLKTSTSFGVTPNSFLKFGDAVVSPPSFLPLYFSLDFLLNQLHILFIPNSFTPFLHDIRWLCLRAHAKSVSDSSAPEECNSTR